MVPWEFCSHLAVHFFLIDRKTYLSGFMCELSHDPEELVTVFRTHSLGFFKSSFPFLLQILTCSSLCSKDSVST